MSGSGAREQLERLLRLLPLATRAEGVGIDEACRELGIDQDQLSRDLHILTERSAYLPGGEADDLQIDLEDERLRVFSPSGAFTRPVRLTAGELLALSVALRCAGVEDPEHHALCGEVERALALRESSRAPDHLGTEIPPTPAPGEPPSDLEAIRDSFSRAVLERRVCIFGYLKPSAEAPELRTVAPWRLVQAEGEWYMVGRDAAREELRLFRLDRVLELRLTAERFDPDPDWDPTELIREGQVMLRTTSREPRSVTVHYSARVARSVRERWEGEETGEGYTVHHTVFDPDWLRRHLMRYGGEARVV